MTTKTGSDPKNRKRERQLTMKDVKEHTKKQVRRRVVAMQHVQTYSGSLVFSQNVAVSATQSANKKELKLTLGPCWPLYC